MPRVALEKRFRCFCQEGPTNFNDDDLSSVNQEYRIFSLEVPLEFLRGENRILLKCYYISSMLVESMPNQPS